LFGYININQKELSEESKKIYQAYYCGLCQKACPWDMMSFDREKQKASKCFLCDGEPKCVKACPAAALTYMPWKDRSGEPARRPTHGYLPEENANQCSVCHG